MCGSMCYTCRSLRGEGDVDFLKFIKGIDEFVFEVMAWLVFFPLTLWRTIRHPLRMMDYADTELTDRPEEQYTDTISPPLFLLLALLLAHLVELVLIGQNPVVRSQAGLAGYVNDDRSLITVRLVLYAGLPMLLALFLLGYRRQAVTRETLRLPFYSQCYVTGALALAIGVGSTLVYDGGWGRPAGLALIVVTLGAYLIVQATWFAQRLQVPWWRGALSALPPLSAGLGLFVAVGALFA